ncbi:MAG TPA: hypothetical protein GXZ55_10105 [Natronincola sp.]|nr:hypothetical protein [Natronincola sp.]
MKRNLMLLTAVVLVAVMLSGCALWPFGKVKVNWTGDAKEVFVKKDMVKRVKKNETTKFDAALLKDVDATKVTLEPPLGVYNEDEKVFEFVIEAKEEAITIKVTLAE